MILKTDIDKLYEVGEEKDDGPGAGKSRGRQKPQDQPA